MGQYDISKAEWLQELKMNLQTIENSVGQDISSMSVPINMDSSKQ